MIAAVVLAAGESVRLGRPKQLLELEGRPLLQHVIDAAATSSVDDIVVVLGHRADEVAGALTLPDRVRVVVNERYLEGQSTSLLAGIGAMHPQAEAVVVLLGDQPRVTAELIERVIGAWRADETATARAYHDDAPRHPVVIPRSSIAGLEGLSGDEGARAVIRSDSKRTIAVPAAEEAVADVDTWADFVALGGAAG